MCEKNCYPGRAFIETLILWIVHRESLHGYEIRKSIEKLTGGSYLPKPGAIYTILRRMEKKGLLKSQWKKSKRIYKVTKKGENILKDRLKRMKERIKLLKKMVSYYESTFSKK